MIKSGFSDILSYFEDAAFPVIILKPNLAVEYINRQANNKFGKYLNRKTWHKDFMEDEIARKVTTNLLAGENVIISPPEVKEFSFLFFQPIPNQNGKIELVRLSIEILSDSHRRFSKNSPNINLFRNIHNELTHQLSTMKMSIEAIRKSTNRNDIEAYIEMMNSCCEVFSSFVHTFDYIYSLMKTYNINEETLFNPKETVDKIAAKYLEVKAVNLIGNHDVLICNPQFFIKTLETIIEHINIHSGTSPIEMKAYEEKAHFVFVFRANINPNYETNYNCLQLYNSDLEIFKTKAKESGGNLIEIKDETQIKILYSIRKHIRADISTEFNQETSFGDPYKI